MPREGGKSVADDLRQRFPAMQWLQGRELHASKGTVGHTWIPLVRAADVAPAVITAVRAAAEDAAAGAQGQTVLFCRDVRSTEAMHAELQ